MVNVMEIFLAEITSISFLHQTKKKEACFGNVHGHFSLMAILLPTKGLCL